MQAIKSSGELWTPSCRPATSRDWLAAQASVRFGRVNRHAWARSFRNLMRRLVSRDLDSILVSISGVQLYAPCWDAGLMGWVLGGLMLERVLLDFLVKAIRPGFTVVDGGAHIGLYTIVAAELAGEGGHVISFEPDARNFPLLERNVRLNNMGDRVRLEPVAIADSEKTMKLWCTAGISTSSTLVAGDVKSETATSVRCTSLDQYFRSHDIARIDLLKLDLEGAEPKCISGMSETITQLKYLVVEVNSLRLRQQSIEPTEFVEEVRGLGRFQFALVCDEERGELVPWDGGRGLRRPLSKFEYANVAFCREPL